MTRPGLVVELGVVEYGRALEFQQQVWRLRVDGAIADTLILLEHHPVITLGRSADPANVLISESELARRGIAVFRIERGGDVTFHGPGQLVGYPVFKLSQGLVGVRRFVERMQSALVRALAGFGVRAGARPGLTGVWVGERKIASIGIAVKERVTRHGFALNVTTDLGQFGLINPCGLAGVRMTSLVVEAGGVETARVRSAVEAGFAAEFGLEFQRNLPRSLTELTKGLSS
uniref:Octanoyltransferase n=1 Tax=candidate division WOR-3 bacterium TaxID=2052148 RepID=A0A7C4CAZ8_UNCW3